jgi:diphosphomevalonate decarboxylase
VIAAAAWAPANLAVVKYWGKRDPGANLPATSSLSATLSALGTRARVEPAERDVLEVAGDPSRALAVLAAARDLSGDRAPLRLVLRNTVPTGAGLASSASSMAALARALGRALGLDGDAGTVQRLARLGSGSAVRSLHGGWVRWDRGEGGEDGAAGTVFPAGHLPLEVRVALVDEAPKAVPSREAMERCRRTSPVHAELMAANAGALEEALAALAARDLAALGAVAEAQSRLLHRDLAAAVPPVDLLGPASRAVMDAVLRLRAGGLPCFFSIDAGPNVAVFAPPDATPAVESALAALPGVRRVLSDRVGAVGASLQEVEP